MILIVDFEQTDINHERYRLEERIQRLIRLKGFSREESEKIIIYCIKEKELMPNDGFFSSFISLEEQ